MIANKKPVSPGTAFRLLSALLILSLSCGTVLAGADKKAVRAFTAKMEKKHGFDRKALTDLLNEATFRDDIIKAISSPAEGKPWYEYRPIFLKQKRIDGGVTFWNENAGLLARASKEYGVAPEIIVAIIGVETRYGTYTGKHKVLDSLYTLGFGYPKRAKFFRSELEQFLILTRDEAVDPATPKGSYAGAMGMPQFISSSYRHYAVDFDGDGKRDLWHNTADVIGSVANFFAEHGWQRDQPVAGPARVTGNKWKALLDNGLKPKRKLAELRSQGVTTGNDWPADTPAMLLELEGKTGPEYWVCLDNFYAITRYNHSALYAMAAYQLSQEILAARNESTHSN